MKNKIKLTSTWIFVCQKYGKFWSSSLITGHFYQAQTSHFRKMTYMIWYGILYILSKIIFSTLTGKICIPWAYNNVLVCKEPYYSHDMALDFRILCSWWCVPTAKKCINFFFARIKKSWSNICRSISLFIILKLVTENVLTTPA